MIQTINEYRKVYEAAKKDKPKVKPGKMHTALGIAKDKEIKDIYKSGKKLATDLVAKVGKKSAMKMLNFAANTNKDITLYSAAVKALEKINESVDSSVIKPGINLIYKQQYGNERNPQFSNDKVKVKSVNGDDVVIEFIEDVDGRSNAKGTERTVNISTLFQEGKINENITEFGKYNNGIDNLYHIFNTLNLLKDEGYFLVDSLEIKPGLSIDDINSNSELQHFNTIEELNELIETGKKIIDFAKQEHITEKFTLEPNAINDIIKKYSDNEGKYNIKTIEDVKSFFTDLVYKLELNFHPDDSFDQYITENGRQLFTQQEASVFDSLMNECFNVCDQNDTDIYEICMEIINKYTDFDKLIDAENIKTEGLGKFVSNVINNDKKMGAVIGKNLASYIKNKPKELIEISDIDFTKAYELAKAANFYSKNIKFENDNQKKAWEYLKGRGTKSMNFTSGPTITPGS